MADTLRRPPPPHREAREAAPELRCNIATPKGHCDTSFPEVKRSESPHWLGEDRDLHEEVEEMCGPSQKNWRPESKSAQPAKRQATLAFALFAAPEPRFWFASCAPM